MSLLQLAVKARVPLIAMMTNDTFNVEVLFREYLKEETLWVWDKSKGSIFAKGSVNYVVNDPSTPYEFIYSKLLDNVGTTLIVVNPTLPLPSYVLEVGTISLPQSAIIKFVSKYAEEDNRAPLVPALSGLSYSQMVNVARMCTVSGGSFTAPRVRDIRRKIFPIATGLQELDTNQSYYSPPKMLSDWMAVDGELLKSGEHPLFDTRGLLFAGPPGTGKTSGAKWLASKLKFPLYLLDMGVVLNKYLGESDKNLRLCLEQAENFSPCVLLFDEIEKLFTGQDSGASTRLLAYLLWWLQEHRAKVLTIMTTNAYESIPQELWRPGRIDRLIGFSRMEKSEQVSFSKEFSDSLPEIYRLAQEELVEVVQEVHGPCTQSVLIGKVLSKVKTKLVNKGV